MYYISIDQLLGLKKIISINYLAALNKLEKILISTLILQQKSIRLVSLEQYHL